VSSFGVLNAPNMGGPLTPEDKGASSNDVAEKTNSGWISFKSGCIKGAVSILCLVPVPFVVFAVSAFFFIIATLATRLADSCTGKQHSLNVAEFGYKWCMFIIYPFIFTDKFNNLGTVTSFYDLETYISDETSVKRNEFIERRAKLFGFERKGANSVPINPTDSTSNIHKLYSIEATTFFANAMTVTINGTYALEGKLIFINQNGKQIAVDMGIFNREGAIFFAVGLCRNAKTLTLDNVTCFGTLRLNLESVDALHIKWCNITDANPIEKDGSTHGVEQSQEGQITGNLRIENNKPSLRIKITDSYVPKITCTTECAQIERNDMSEEMLKPLSEMLREKHN
jgi:hypothetical protein